MNDRAPFFPRRATQLNAFAALAFSFGILGHCAEALAANLPGRIAGQFEAAASGAATYTIPIQVASGLNGLGPAIALGYDSSSGDGHAGMRWSISGLSQVHRCPLTRALDGRVQGVGLGPEDRFCLDGEPLVLQSGTHGAAGAEYRRELHGFERVIAQGREGSGPAWFEVRRPDGLVYRYGNDADSRITAPGSGEVRAWALNEVEDRFQQRMGFSYAQDAVSGEHWPAEIRWTYAAAQSPDQARYRLVFSYEERPAEDRRSGYVAGSPWRSSQRLTSIDYEFREAAGFTRVHRYRLEYAAPTALGTQRSQLASITQCGPRDCLPPTTFAWDNGRAGWEDILFELSQPVVGAVLGDFDGDGKTDIFAVGDDQWLAWPAAGSSGQPGAPVTITSPAGSQASGIGIDYNGDGRTDLLARASPTAGWTAYLAPGNPGGAFEARSTDLNSAGNGEPIAIDIDADGFDDLVYLRNGTAWLRRNVGGALGPEQAAGIGPARVPYVAAQGAEGWLSAADFDGDGRGDLLAARSRDGSGNLVWEAYLSNGAGFDAEPFGTLGSTTRPTDVIVLDINGDGLSDVLRTDPRYWQPYLSRGAGSAGAAGFTTPACVNPLPAGDSMVTVAVDYDGDGRVDLLEPYGRNAWRVYRSDGECFHFGERYADVSGPDRYSVSRVAIADRNGDGNPDVLFGHIFGYWQLAQHRHESRSDGAGAARVDLVRTITDGLGNSHSLTYQPLSGWGGYTLIDGPVPAGSRLLRGGPLAVLSQWVSNAADGNSYSVKLSYASLRADSSGRGLLGFQRIRAIDSRTGLMTESSYRQDFPYIGRTDRVTVWDGANKVSDYRPAWAAAATAAPDPALDTHFVYLEADRTESYEVDQDGGYRGNLVRATERTLTWNLNHGAVTREETVVTAPQEQNGRHISTRSVTLDEGLRSSAGCLGVPSRIDLTREGLGGGTRTVQYSYNPGTCRLLAETEGPAGNPLEQQRTTYTYDSVGRVTAVTRTDGAGTLPARETRYTYPADGPRPLSEAQRISGEPDLVTTHTWNDALGVEQSRTVPAGTTSWAYDDFGRPTLETRPAGSTQTTYAACGPCLSAHARYSVRESRSDGYWSETQHDSFGNVVGSSFVLHDNHTSRQITEYDAMGRMVRQTEPFRDDELDAVFWTSYRYDLVGRPKLIDRPVSESVPSGSLTSFTYNGLDVTSYDAEMRATRRMHDTLGRLKIVIPPLGTNTGYSWTVFDQLAVMIDPGWNTTYFEYDDRGRLVHSESPDSGERYYTYNVFGELLSQSDGSDPPAVQTLEYDQLGRLTRRTEPEGITTWTYVSAGGAARGQLQSVVAPADGGSASFQENYAYDSLGRVQQVATVIDGTRYETDYAYGSEGKLTGMTYPSTVGWRPKFKFGYSKGQLARIFLESVTRQRIYTLLRMEASGRESLALLGEAVLLERNVYDRASTRLAAIQSGPPMYPESLQDYAYEWDRVGNLLARRSAGNGAPIEERFAYDELNRLKQATLDGVQTLSMIYTKDGNIRSRSDVGNFAYGYYGVHPHGVSAIGGGARGIMTFGYDDNGNMTNRNGTALTWTSYNLPRQIGSDTNYVRFSYGPRRTRTRQEVRSATGSKTVHHVGPHFEVEIEGPVRRFRSNLFANGRAVYSQVETSSGGIEGYYVLHDHLGSVDRLVRAAGSGADTLAFSFDAWGKRRNTDWSADNADARAHDQHWVERGFTGHEHLDAHGLIHMNGRLADPLLGRMLSPDPMMGSTLNPQSFNPYSYTLNNPASYADPSGYLLSGLRKTIKRAIRHAGSVGQRIVRRWGRQIVATVAAVYTANVVSSWAYSAQTSAIDIAGPAFLTTDGISAAGTLSAAAGPSTVIGGVAGGAVAGAIGSGNLQGTLVGGLSGGVMGGINVTYGGGYKIGRVLAEATAGGVTAELQGGDFASGLITGGSLSSLTWAALEMRSAMIEQSRRNPANAAGSSAGFRGDGFKLGGCRRPCLSSPLGGAQGGPGIFLGAHYSPDSFLDRLVETYSGPHDFLNSPIFYNEFGDNIVRPDFFHVFNAANVLLATPFAAASVVPSYAYGALSD